MRILPVLILIVFVFGQLSCAKQSQPASNSSAQNQDQILTKVREIVARKLELAPDAINVDIPLSKQKAPGDELDAVEIILDIEDEFHIEIKEEETGGTEQLADRLTVRKLADIVAKKLAK
jgi:acyl carrier protein